jgi:hypothetical protein
VRFSQLLRFLNPKFSSSLILVGALVLCVYFLNLKMTKKNGEGWDHHKMKEKAMGKLVII